MRLFGRNKVTGGNGCIKWTVCINGIVHSLSSGAAVTFPAVNELRTVFFTGDTVTPGSAFRFLGLSPAGLRRAASERGRCAPKCLGTTATDPLAPTSLFSSSFSPEDPRLSLPHQEEAEAAAVSHPVPIPFYSIHLQLRHS